MHCCGQETKTVDRSVEACNLEAVVVAPQVPKSTEASHQSKATVPCLSTESKRSQTLPIQYVDCKSQTKKSRECDVATQTHTEQYVDHCSQTPKAEFTASHTQISKGHVPAIQTSFSISTETQHDPIQTKEKCNQSINCHSKKIQCDPIAIAEVGLQALVEKVNVTSTASPEVTNNDSQTNGLIEVVDQQLQTERVGENCGMQTEQISTKSKETQTEAKYHRNSEDKNMGTCSRDNGDGRRDRTDNVDRRGDRDRDNTAHYGSYRDSPSAYWRTARKNGGAQHNDHGIRTARKKYPATHHDEQRPPSPRKELAHDSRGKTVYLPTADKDSNAVALFYKFMDFIKHFYSIPLNVHPLENLHQHPAILPCVGATRLGDNVTEAFTKSKLPSKCDESVQQVL